MSVSFGSLAFERTSWAENPFAWNEDATPSESDDVRGEGISALISVSSDDDGRFTVTSLPATTGEFEASITSVQEDFTVVEDGQLFAGIDAAEATVDLPEDGDSRGTDSDATPEASPEVIVSNPDATPDA